MSHDMSRKRPSRKDLAGWGRGAANRINNLQHRSFRPCHKILEDPHIKTYLTELESKYVLVPADEAGNIIIFVCKYYYQRHPTTIFGKYLKISVRKTI